MALRTASRGAVVALLAPRLVAACPTCASTPVDLPSIRVAIALLLALPFVLVAAIAWWVRRLPAVQRNGDA